MYADTKDAFALVELASKDEADDPRSLLRRNPDKLDSISESSEDEGGETRPLLGIDSNWDTESLFAAALRVIRLPPFLLILG
jgi:hypothetical protein